MERSGIAIRGVPCQLVYKYPFHIVVLPVALQEEDMRIGKPFPVPRSVVVFLAEVIIWRR